MSDKRERLQSFTHDKVAVATVFFFWTTPKEPVVLGVEAEWRSALVANGANFKTPR